MRKKSLKLPLWIIKKIESGKEDENCSSMLVGCLALYTVGVIVYFASAPFGREHLILEMIAALGILAFIVCTGLWFLAQIALLDAMRREALAAYKNSKTKSEIEESEDRLKKLYIPIPEAD